MKKFAYAILVCAFVLSMTACSTGEGSSVTSGSADSSDTSNSGSAPSESKPENVSSESESPEEHYALGQELTSSMLENSVYNEGDLTRLARVIKKLKEGGDVTIAYLGGSITQGTSAGNELCYARLTTNWFEETFPDANINYVNAGIGGTGSYIGVHRCDEQVLSKNPDLVFIDFSVNDTTERTEINKSTYESLIRKIWDYDTKPAIVTIAMTQQNGTSFQEYHGEIVKKYNIPMISYKNVILDVIGKDYIKWSDISDDDIHPNVQGHDILAGLITNFIQSAADKADGIDTSSDPVLPEASENGAKYVNARLITSDNTDPVSLGAFQKAETTFGGFENPWLMRSSDGVFSEDDALVFEVEAQNIGLLYGKLVSNAGMADIYVDDKLVTTINADFTGGWGNYADFTEIVSFDSVGKHTLKIMPKTIDGACAFYVSAVALS